ncbi:hypothetical protein ACSS7Z_04345 [Microbacterium sp. A82]|uniref:hypothetical protein n=1 Tax=unclassified Microbacterium TaxID=2609290 RepID=UPI003F2ECE3B
MSRREGDAFERLLIWYPKWWREVNGDVFLGALRDHAEHEGRATPSRGEGLSAVVNGVALRLDTRVALWSSVVALVLSAGAWLLVLFRLGSASTGIITSGIAPILTLVGLIALMRSRGWMMPLRALMALFVLSCALVLAVLAQLSWAQGFILADANHALSGISAVWVPLFIAGWVCGGLGLAVLFDGILGHTRTPWFGRLSIALVAGALIAPVLGAGLLNPMMSSIVAAGVAVLALGTLGRRDTVPARTPAAPARSHDSLHAAQWLGWLSAVGGLVGVAYAFTGTVWSSAATDGTVAMGQGITISLTASIPLIAAVGIGASKRRGLIVVWGPLCLAVLAVVAVTIAYTAAPEWEDMGPWMMASAALGGGGLAWWLTPRLRGSFGFRLAAGIAIGTAYAALLGIMAAPAFAFVVPILGVIVALRAWRGGRAAQSHAAREAPVSPVSA